VSQTGLEHSLAALEDQSLREKERPVEPREGAVQARWDYLEDV
jgi:hypothetical protein